MDLTNIILEHCSREIPPRIYIGFKFKFKCYSSHNITNETMEQLGRNHQGAESDTEAQHLGETLIVERDIFCRRRYRAIGG